MRPSTGTLRALGIALLTGVAPSPSSPAPAPAAPTALGAGSSLERDMAVEEVHRYTGAAKLPERVRRPKGSKSKGRSRSRAKATR